MTEKRFTQKDEDDWEILDRNKHFAYAHSGYQAKKIIERLNELSDKLDCHILLTDQERQKASNFINGIEKENEQLKKQLGSKEKAHTRCDELYQKLYDENEELKHRIKKLQNELNNYSEICNELNALVDENEHLKFKLEEVRSDEKQLGISFMEFKMKLIEKLQIHYDYATEQKQKNLNDIFVAKAYDIIRYDIKKLAEEMGVDLE